jgi:hypothetical protein
VVEYAHRLSLLTNSLECCRHSDRNETLNDQTETNDGGLSAPFPSRSASRRE